MHDDAYPWGMVGSDWTGAMMPSKSYLSQTYLCKIIKIDSCDVTDTDLRIPCSCNFVATIGELYEFRYRL